MKSNQNYNLIVSSVTMLLITVRMQGRAEECFEKTSRAIFKFNMAV